MFRKAVLKTYNNTCVKCGYRADKYMVVHHLNSWHDNFDQRIDVNNAVVLCPDCHDIGKPNSFHTIYGNRNNTRKQFEEFLNRPIP